MNVDTSPGLHNEVKYHEMQDCCVSRALVMATEEHRANKSFSLSHFSLFRLAASLNFKKLTYSITRSDEISNQLHLMDEDHAAAIGRALTRKNLDSFVIEFSTVTSGNCWRVLADKASDTSISELCIAYKSAHHQETPETSAAVAYLCTKLKVQHVHLWSPGFDDEAMYAFANELAELDNCTLQFYDIQDIMKSPAHCMIRDEKLDEFVMSNRH